jgi:hypothetical protein
MGDPEKGGERRVLDRLERDDQSVVTVNIRSSRLFVFWSSVDLAVPIDPGWYFHAASLPSNAPQQNGEARRLAAPFDPADQNARWDHAKIGNFSKADLFLDPGRRYLFYVTPQAADRDALLRDNRPWPYVFRAPKSPQEPAMIGFQILTPLEDCHREKKKETAAKAQQSDPSTFGFGPVDHDSFVSAFNKNKLSVQLMIDGWALDGLIDGGAMIDTSGSFSAWKLACPDPSNPSHPYDSTDTTASSLWHYVIPSADNSGAPVADNRWTASSLSTAIANGRAVALTAGQAVMLGGDLFEKPADMENDTARWKKPDDIPGTFISHGVSGEEARTVLANAPQSVMQVYWDARKWIATSVKNGKPDWSRYQQKYGVIYLIFDIMTRDPSSFGQSTVDDIMDAPSLGVDGMKSPDGSQIWAAAFEKFAKRAKKVNAVVDLLHQAVGSTRFSEIHFLVQALGYDGGTSFNWLHQKVPWLDQVDIHQTLSLVGFTADEVKYLEKSGPNDEFVQFAATNGRYADLAIHNGTHFSNPGVGSDPRDNGDNNARTFEKFHTEALKLITAHCQDKSALRPIPSQAVFRTGFACHFLTDAFSASHMRVPRNRLGPFSSKLMHDVEGLVGLWVYHRPGGREENYATWRAYGDGYLWKQDLDDKQKTLLTKDGWGRPITLGGNLGNVDTDPNANYEKGAAAVGSAFKQLNYQAHATSAASPTVKALLLNSYWPAGDPSAATGLTYDYIAPGSAGPGSLSENLDMNTGQRVDFVKSQIPTPYTEAEQGSFVQFTNMPPLYSQDPTPKLLLDGTYTAEKDRRKGDGITDGWKADLRGYTHWEGFTLHADWGKLGEFLLDFDKYFYMIKFSKDVQGLKEYMDKLLLDTYDKLPEV